MLLRSTGRDKDEVENSPEVADVSDEVRFGAKSVLDSCGTTAGDAD